MQEKILKLDNVDIIIIKSKIKNIYFGIKEGQAYMKVPLLINDRKIVELAKSKLDWYKKKLNNIKEPRKLDLKKYNYIYVLNNKIPIEYIYEKRVNIKVILNEKECKIILPENAKLKDADYEKIEKKLDGLLKTLARKYIFLSMNKYIKLTGLSPNEIQIRKFKSIWGNCSSKKVIKINQNIIYYGLPQIEYVCLHEITHLKYMNHKKEFWNFVKKYMPDYKAISSELK